MVDAEEPGTAYWNHLEPYWNGVSIYDGPEVFLRDFASLPPGIGHLLATQWCQSEVGNGGLHQFFSNPTAVLAPEAVRGFRALALDLCAAILEEAMAFFGAPYPREQHLRIAALEQQPGTARDEWDPFHALDKLFDQAIDSDHEGYEKAADAFSRTLAV